LDDLPLFLRRAFHSSVTPPREPVFISLPMNILDEIGSPKILPPSRIELSSVSGQVEELAAGLLRERSGAPPMKKHRWSLWC
jgi:benzoylformate decarboxylase